MRRSLSIDVLKIILAFFVVFLHMHLLRDTYPELSYVLVNGLFRIGVPVFLIITGYYFYHIDTADKLKKWLVRLFLLYALWSLIYIPIWKEDDSWVMNIIFGYHHLWYLIGTFFAGIMLFFLRKKSTVTLVVISLVLFCCGYCIQLWGNLHPFTGNMDSTLNAYPLYRNFLFVCFPFLSVGFLIKKLDIDVKLKPSLFQVMLVIGLVMLEAFFNYKIIGLDKKDSIDLLFSLMIACPVVFLYGKNKIFLSDSKILANLSTAIYLVHPLLMKLMLERHFSAYETGVFIVVLLLVSLLLVYVNRKIKYLL
ncbi:acyltransferase family protein [Chryseobacterium tongliaoense]|uniref:acyltransferase family protein n=1 Tax=Chryseobacterium tongliaoense TaxID=3240933 RepID=UPI0035137287